MKRFVHQTGPIAPPRLAAGSHWRPAPSCAARVRRIVSKCTTWPTACTLYRCVRHRPPHRMRRDPGRQCLDRRLNRADVVPLHCQPLKALPSYSIPRAIRIKKRAPAGAPPIKGAIIASSDCSSQSIPAATAASRRRPSARRCLRHDLFEDTACTVLITHLDVGARKVQFGGDIVFVAVGGLRTEVESARAPRRSSHRPTRRD